MSRFSLDVGDGAACSPRERRVATSAPWRPQRRARRVGARCAAAEGRAPGRRRQVIRPCPAAPILRQGARCRVRDRPCRRSRPPCRQAGADTQPPTLRQPRRARLLAASTPRSRPPGDDAAYEAFDQGKYVTALQLAVKAAERGEPKAHTLVGRIYAEGYGTSKNSGLAAQWYARGAELGDPEAMFA